MNAQLRERLLAESTRMKSKSGMASYALPASTCALLREAAAALAAPKEAGDALSDEAICAIAKHDPNGQRLASMLRDDVVIGDFRAALTGLVRRLAAPSKEAGAVGMARASAYVQKKADDYAMEHCSTEHDTGAAVYHYGQAGEDYHHGLLELAEELAGLAAVLHQDQRAVGAGPWWSDKSWADAVQLTANPPVDQRQEGEWLELPNFHPQRELAIASPPTEAAAAVEQWCERVREIAAQLANDDCEGDAADLLDALAALSPTASAAREAQPAAAEVDWCAMYRFQTAMRYMDASPKLTKDRAYAMADEDVASLERAAIKGDSHAG